VCACTHYLVFKEPIEIRVLLATVPDCPPDLGDSRRREVGASIVRPEANVLAARAQMNLARLL